MAAGGSAPEGCAGMREKEWKTDCPTCAREVRRSPSRKAPFFPFCSERCRLIDLGKWLDGEHRIEEPLAEGADLPPEGDDAPRR
jgi:endogenous inhibitor of DNA gyrase (YacG/DUF329 family)